MITPLRNKTHGDGTFRHSDFKMLGPYPVFERGVLVFHPENISIGRNVYVGHYAILKGYHRNEMIIGDETWIGQGVFMHSAGGIIIGDKVGIGPGVQIITSYHDHNRPGPLLEAPVKSLPVTIGDGADIGVNAVILPGVSIGKNAVVGAGSVVTTGTHVKDEEIAVGVPARVVGKRGVDD